MVFMMLKSWMNKGMLSCWVIRGKKKDFPRNLTQLCRYVGSMELLKANSEEILPRSQYIDSRKQKPIRHSLNI